MKQPFSPPICFGCRCTKRQFSINTGLAILTVLGAMSAWSQTNQVQLKMTATPEGVRFGTLRDLPSKPLPTVFFFGGPASLTDAESQEAQQVLGPAVLCVALDAPAEGELRGTGEPLSLGAWRLHVDRGEDIISNLTHRAKAVLDHLIQQQATDPAKVAVFGTSRGGYMAFHFAAVEPRVHAIAAFAPVTDLLVMTEFAGRTNDHLIRAAAANNLADRNIWILIGSTDHRVSTTRAMQFTQRIIEASEALGRRPGIELHVVPSDGHRVPDGSYAEAARWLLKQWHSIETLPKKNSTPKRGRK